MTWLIIGIFLGGVAGFMTAALLAAGARADILTENAILRGRVDRLTRDAEHA